MSVDDIYRTYKFFIGCFYLIDFFILHYIIILFILSKSSTMDMQSEFQNFTDIIVPGYSYNGINFDMSSIIQDNCCYYIDCKISVSRDYKDQPVIWATIKLRLSFCEQTNTWSAYKIWEFLVNPYEKVINTYRFTLVRDVSYMEAVLNIAGIMKCDIVKLADDDSNYLDLDYYWDEYRYNYGVEIDSVSRTPELSIY